MDPIPEHEAPPTWIGWALLVTGIAGLIAEVLL